MKIKESYRLYFWIAILGVLVWPMAGCKGKFPKPTPYTSEEIGIQINIESLSPETERAFLKIIDEAIGGDKKEFCITAFDANGINKIDYLCIDDPNCLITVTEFLFRTLGYRDYEN